MPIAFAGRSASQPCCAGDVEAASLLDDGSVRDLQPQPVARRRAPLVRATLGAVGAVSLFAAVHAWGPEWSSHAPVNAKADRTIQEWGQPWPKQGQNQQQAWGWALTTAAPAKPAAPTTTPAPATTAAAGSSAVQDVIVRADAGSNLKDLTVKGTKTLSAEETATRKEALEKANGIFSEPAAKAFAALAKLAYCGPVPGVPAAVATSCSAVQIVGVTSACEEAKFGVMPGMVRMLTSSDANTSTPNAYFAYAAQVVPYGDDSTFQPGVLLSFRGSVDNYGNSVRDKQTQLQMLPEDDECPGCGLHKGYHEEFHSIWDQLQLALNELCLDVGQETCTVYTTGHGAGAATATIVMYELARKGYNIGPSYLFESPQVGNNAMADKFNDLFAYTMGPVFQVTHGRDSLPRWPFEKDYQSWGIEAWYSEAAHDTKGATHSGLCWAGDSTCGIHRIAPQNLTQTHACEHPLAPADNFCVFREYVPQCYGGLGFSIIDANPNLPMGDVEQPLDQAAASWSPAEASGKHVQELAKPHKASDFYSLDVLKAAAALAKLTYCGNSVGVAGAVQSTCNGRSGVCANAGFGVVPSSVHPVSASNDNLFFYTALARRSTSEFADAPHFLPSEFCLLAFRGTVTEANSNMNRQVSQVPLNDENCTDCTVSFGLAEAWILLQPLITQALEKSGCDVGGNNQVMIVGHSMGGTMATLAAYKLNYLGYDVQTSWSIEGGRPGNPELMEYINNHMIKTRPVPLWQVTNANDGIPRTPKTTYSGGSVGRDRYMVFIENNKPGKATLCTEEVSEDSNCGNLKYTRDQLVLKVPSNEHCALKFAPDGQMCMFASAYWPSPYRMAGQCTTGGSL